MPLFRYAKNHFDGRRILIRICARLQGKKVHFIDRPSEDIEKVLKHSNKKGDFLERLVALPAWSPILSIESSDDETWRSLIKVFRPIFKQAIVRSDLKELTAQEISLFSSRNRHNDIVVDGEHISRITVQIFFNWIFGRRLNQEEEDLYYQASIEWRKEIGVKGRASGEIKRKFWEHLRRTYLASDFCAGREVSTDTEKSLQVTLSAIAQPFLISPQINFSDILATLFQRLDQKPELKKLFLETMKTDHPPHLDSQNMMQSFFLEAIRLEHPFPILERELQADLNVQGVKLTKGTQVFIMLDELKQDQEFNPHRWEQAHRSPYHAIPFGAGERVCPGQRIALTTLATMVTELLKTWRVDQVRPFENHLYSGRHNDTHEGFHNFFAQARMAFHAIRQSYLLRPKSHDS